MGNPIKKLVKSIPQIKKVVEARDFYMAQSAQLRQENERLAAESERFMMDARNGRNLIATLYGKEEYYSDIVVGGSYRHVATFTTAIGCPVKCRYCPQSVFVRAYGERRNPVKKLTLDIFKTMLAKIPKDVIISFTGFVDDFANPECLDMIIYTLNQGYKTRVFSTMYNASIETYQAFADHENLTTFDLHLPDCQGNTVFPITDSYKSLLCYIVAHKPKHGTFWTSCLGIDGGVHPEISDIIQVNPNPVNSVHGLVYPNYLDHGTVDLSCKRDCSRLDFPKAGVGAILPNGDVIGCTQDWELKHVIGNLLDAGSWDEIINGPERARFKAALTDPSIPSICRHCELAVRINAGTKIE
ncbi:SPASM domain-containing protein [Anaerotruncus colihominis]|uniref:SPASM domain-containing protein n=1 Tax=Anaerotruncus colihominis TaxID=169435 RepID=UPI003517507B